MKQLLEYLNDYNYDVLVINEMINIIVSDEIVNESFKSTLVQKLAQKIYDIEKDNNIKKIERAKDQDERYPYSDGSKHDPNLTNFASIFGPKVKSLRYGPDKKGIQGLKWSEITDNDFKEYVPNDKALIKLIKKTYGKADANANYIITDPDGNIINFIKAYGEDAKSDGMYYFKSERMAKYGDGTKYKINSELKEYLKDYYSYKTRPLKAGEVIDMLNELAEVPGIKVYALEITNDMIKDYKDLIDTRTESQKGVINYDKKSLDNLLKLQRSRYKVLADAMRAKKLQDNSKDFFEEIKKTNEEVIKLYEKIMSKPEYLDIYFDMGELMSYVSSSYKSFYQSVKSKYQADKDEKTAKDHKADNPKIYRKYNDERAQEAINDAQEYVNKVKKMMSKIEEELAKH